MPAYATSFEAAPLDRTARIVTRSIWALAIVFVLVGAVIAAFGSTASGIVMLAVGVLVVVLNVWMRRIQPLSYDVGADGLRVRRRSAAPSSFAGRIGRVRRGSLGLRVFGDGGGYGYLGRYRADGRTVRAFVTDRRSVVLLDVGDAPIALSPRDPDQFVAEAAGGT